MTPPQINVIFQAQTENVRELERVWKRNKYVVNEAYRTNDVATAEFQTRMLALVFCAYTEAMFSKLIHTPHGFESAEIESIKRIAKRNIFQGWVKCLEIASGKICNGSEEYRARVESTVLELVNSYIKEPSEIRNKIAHGQWKVALNSTNTAVNQAATDKVHAIDLVDLIKYKKSFVSLSVIMEDIIESPNNAHWQFYERNVTEYHAEQQRMSSWSLADKVALLKPKQTVTSRMQ